MPIKTYVLQPFIMQRLVVKLEKFPLVVGLLQCGTISLFRVLKRVVQFLVARHGNLTRHWESKRFDYEI